MENSPVYAYAAWLDGFSTCIWAQGTKDNRRSRVVARMVRHLYLDPNGSEVASLGVFPTAEAANVYLRTLQDAQ